MVADLLQLAGGRWMWGSVKKIRLESLGHIWTNANMSAVHDLIEIDIMYRLDLFGSCSVSDSFWFHHPGTIGQLAAAVGGCCLKMWKDLWVKPSDTAFDSWQIVPVKLRYSNMSMLIAKLSMFHWSQDAPACCVSFRTMTTVYDHLWRLWR